MISQIKQNMCLCKEWYGDNRNCPSHDYRASPFPPEQEIPRIKISGLGWVCVWDRGEWIAVTQLNDEQMREYREFMKVAEKVT